MPFQLSRPNAGVRRIVIAIVPRSRGIIGRDSWNGTNRNRDGQGTLEYLLMAIVVFLAILYGVRKGGPLQLALNKVFANAMTVVGDAANAVGSKF